MSNEEYLAKVHCHVQRLNLLLEDPQPGLYTWCMMFAQEMGALVELWEDACLESWPS